MTQKLAMAVLILGALTFSVGGVAWAAEEKHEGSKKHANESQETQAVKHTKEAIAEGKAGKAGDLRKQAEVALKYAEKAEKKQPEPHIAEGIKHLKMAVEEAQKGNATEGTKHAEEALKHLEAK